jgi:hypothetical protein
MAIVEFLCEYLQIAPPGEVCQSKRGSEAGHFVPFTQMLTNDLVAVQQNSPKASKSMGQIIQDFITGKISLGNRAKQEWRENQKLPFPILEIFTCRFFANFEDLESIFEPDTYIQKYVRPALLGLYGLWDQNGAKTDLTPDEVETKKKVQKLCDRLLEIGLKYRDFSKKHFNLQHRQWRTGKDAFVAIEKAHNEVLQKFPAAVQNAIIAANADRTAKNLLPLTTKQERKVAKTAKNKLLDLFKLNFKLNPILPGILDDQGVAITANRDPVKERAYYMAYANTVIYETYGFDLSRASPWARLCTLIFILKGNDLRGSLLFFVQQLFGEMFQPELVETGESSNS